MFRAHGVPGSPGREVRACETRAIFDYSVAAASGRCCTNPESCTPFRTPCWSGVSEVSRTNTSEREGPALWQQAGLLVDFLASPSRTVMHVGVAAAS